MVAKTQNIKIGFAACVSTLHHPVRLAEDFANLDVLSDGRLIIGLTRTSLNEHCHEVFQSPIKKAWGKFNEQFEIMKKLWQNKLGEHSGSFYKIPSVSIYPLPIQQPFPPIFFIANSDSSIIDAACKGVGIFLHAFQNISSINRKKKLYEDHFIDILGMGPKIILSRFIYVGDNNRKAIADIQNPLMHFIEEHIPHIKVSLKKQHKTKIDFSFFEELGIFGSGVFCMEKIRAISSETGINNFTFLFNLITLDHQKSLDSMKIFAQHIDRSQRKI